MTAWASLTMSIALTAVGLPLGVVLGLIWLVVKHGSDRDRAGG